MMPRVMAKLSDNELMILAGTGDRGAFEQLVTRYRTKVSGLAVKMLGNREDSEEAVQDAFWRLWRACGRFDADRPLVPWLLRIASNVCRDRLRRRRVASRCRVDAWSNLEDIPDLREGEGVAHAPDFSDVLRELALLKDRLRVTLELKYLRGYTQEEVALAMGISRSTAKKNLSDGRAILASRLARSLA